MLPAVVASSSDGLQELCACEGGAVTVTMCMVSEGDWAMWMRGGIKTRIQKNKSGSYKYSCPQLFWYVAVLLRRNLYCSTTRYDLPSALLHDVDLQLIARVKTILVPTVMRANN
jgi:hypothetical protein